MFAEWIRSEVCVTVRHVLRTNYTDKYGSFNWLVITTNP